MLCNIKSVIFICINIALNRLNFNIRIILFVKIIGHILNLYFFEMTIDNGDT